MAEKTATVIFRTSPAVKAQAEKAAAADGRTLSAWLESAIKEALQQRKGKPK